MKLKKLLSYEWDAIAGLLAAVDAIILHLLHIVDEHYWCRSKFDHFSGHILKIEWPPYYNRIMLGHRTLDIV